MNSCTPFAKIASLCDVDFGFTVGDEGQDDGRLPGFVDGTGVDEESENQGLTHGSRVREM